MDGTFASPMPSELVCLAARMQLDSAGLAMAASELPGAFAAVANYTGPTPDCAEELKTGTRMHQFDADRLGALVDAQDKALRGVFALTLELVDRLRVASAYVGKNTVEAGVFINYAADQAADIQAKICELFPGEEFPSN
jgi:hypothetical protein